ncbi:MAG: transglycosylase SLT domain-containing protein, partial [Acidobacteria bacterium]|nr:transglycosylase SLT domain-containing protein [Acidobacteriota bacterium]
MNFQRRLLLVLAGIILATMPVMAQSAAPVRSYQQLTLSERRGFVAQQARSVARKMSGTEYQFTPEFEAEIQQAVEAYAARIGNGGGDRLWKGEARFVFERGQSYAPILINAFRAQGVSPLMGLYIPLVESEYVNLQTPNSVGALGLFQFLPRTGERFGLTTQELLDVEKSADAAARYLAKNLALFQGDKMK